MSGADIHAGPVAADVVLELCDMLLSSLDVGPVVYWTATDTGSGMSWDMCGHVSRVGVGAMGRLVFVVSCDDTGREYSVPGDMVTDWGWS